MTFTTLIKPEAFAMREQLVAMRRDLHMHPGFGAFMPRGRAPAVGEIWRFADQADTLADEIVSLWALSGTSVETSG